MGKSARLNVCVRVAGSGQRSLWCWDVEMKIDEKVLAYFESGNSPVDKEGYLQKKVMCFNAEVDHVFSY